METTELFTTQDVQLYCTLLGRGHKVTDDGISKSRDNTIWFTFENKKVENDVALYKQGKPLQVDIHLAMWAYSMFRSVLYGETKDMFTVIALRVMGNELGPDDVYREGGSIRYKFQGEKAKKDRNAFWEGKDIKVNHSDLWNMMGWYKSNIRSL